MEVGNEPTFDPANFTSPVDNPYFPLRIGQVAILRGQEDGTRFAERVTVTDRTKVIQGITTTVVLDKLWEDGYLAERTRDWYAADNDGNVWYFGEATETLDRGGHVTARTAPGRRASTAPSPGRSCPPTHGRPTPTGRS